VSLGAGGAGGGIGGEAAFLESLGGFTGETVGALPLGSSLGAGDPSSSSTGRFLFSPVLAVSSLTGGGFFSAF